MTHDPRPRDALGRPMPRDSGVAVEPAPDPLPPAQSLALAQTLLDDGRAFRAHEVLEATWKAERDDRDLWRGLAQLAVGVTHAQRGNVGGAAALLRRAADTLQPWDAATPHDVDVARLRQWATAAADAVRADVEAVAQRRAMPSLVRRSGG